MMKKILYIMMLSLALVATGVDAKGGSSSGGGGHASSGGRSSSSSFSSGSKGGFSSSSVSRPSSTTTTTTRSTTTYARSSNGSYYHYSSPYIVGGGMMYGGWGMGYGYSNGLITGIIIANMMHPNNTVMYSGPGQYNNNALLYPDGRVVNQQGYQVGTYVNGQFVAMQNGPLVAQQVPTDAGAQQVQPQPIVIDNGPSALEIFGMVMLSLIAIGLFVMFLGML